MPSDLENTSSREYEALCHKCGKVFTAFLDQMEAQNAKVVCPDCGKEGDCGPPPAAAKPSVH